MEDQSKSLYLKRNETPQEGSATQTPPQCSSTKITSPPGDLDTQGLSHLRIHDCPLATVLGHIIHQTENRSPRHKPQRDQGLDARGNSSSGCPLLTCTRDPLYQHSENALCSRGQRPFCSHSPSPVQPPRMVCDLERGSLLLYSALHRAGTV